MQSEPQEVVFSQNKTKCAQWGRGGVKLAVIGQVVEMKQYVFKKRIMILGYPENITTSSPVPSGGQG